MTTSKLLCREIKVLPYQLEPFLIYFLSFNGRNDINLCLTVLNISLFVSSFVIVCVFCHLSSVETTLC